MHLAVKSMMQLDPYHLFNDLIIRYKNKLSVVSLMIFIFLAYYIYIYYTFSILNSVLLIYRPITIASAEASATSRFEFLIYFYTVKFKISSL